MVTGSFTLQQALPVFAAIGHFSYLKSVYLHLENMNNFADNNNHVYDWFNNGHFVVRRSSRYWPRLSTDLVIEQELMMSLKTTGGLTRGSGFTECQRAVRLLSMPICSLYSSKMHDITEKFFVSSDQHKTTSFSRIQRDRNDTEKDNFFYRARQTKF